MAGVARRERVGDDPRDVGPVPETVGQHRPRPGINGLGEVPVQARDILAQRLVEVKVRVLAVDPGIDDRPDDPPARGIVGPAGRIGLDGAAGGVDGPPRGAPLIWPSMPGYGRGRNG